MLSVFRCRRRHEQQGRDYKNTLRVEQIRWNSSSLATLKKTLNVTINIQRDMYVKWAVDVLALCVAPRPIFLYCSCKSRDSFPPTKYCLTTRSMFHIFLDIVRAFVRFPTKRHLIPAFYY